MIKGFWESLHDGFRHIKEISDPQTVKHMREEGILIDSEGIYTFTFGDHQEYELRIEPVGGEEEYMIALYKNSVLLTQKLPVCVKKTNQT